MILIADSGSTKTHWKVINVDKSIETIYTRGLNPYFTDEGIFHTVLNSELVLCKNEVQEVHFYGSGCGTKEKILLVKKYLKSCFTSAEINVYSDLLGAARALLGRDKGIACILGTGSVSCIYDGKEIKSTTPSLGFILGDEGGGAMLGKELLRAYFYNKLPENIKNAFIKNFKITREEVLDKVYRQPSPNAYLASFSKFIRTCYHDPFIHDMVYNCFKDFFNNHVMVYPEYKKLPLVFTGSVSANLKEILEEVAGEFGIKISKIMKEPMDGLVEFHRNTNID